MKKPEVGQKLYMTGTEPGRRSAIDGCKEVIVTYVGRIYFEVGRKELRGLRDFRFRLNDWRFSPKDKYTGARGHLKLYESAADYEAVVAEQETRSRLQAHCRRGTSYGYGYNNGIWEKLPLDAVEDILKILDDKLPKENS